MVRYDLVEKAYRELVTECKIFPTATDYERHKALLTRRAAYYLNQADPNLGLLRKTSGNNVDGLSVDVIVNGYTGENWDIASDTNQRDGTRLAVPVDGGVRINPEMIPNWVRPTYELAGFGAPHNDIPAHTDVPHEDAPQNPPDEVDMALLNIIIEAMRKMVQEEVAKLKFPTYEGTINLGRFLGTAQIELKPKESE